MIFVGRKKESDLILKALSEGRNVVITGKYGIGRTSLVHHISQIAEKKWHFVFTDFSKTAKAICSASLAELYPRQDIHKLAFKSVRGRLAYFAPRDSRKTVLVMDNIAKLTRQKFSLIRYLALQNHFQFIAITEMFLKKSELDRLRGQLLPEIFIQLSYLTREDSVELVRRYYEICKKKFVQADADLLAFSTHGYPLGIQNYFQSKLS